MGFTQRRPHDMLTPIDQIITERNWRDFATCSEIPGDVFFPDIQAGLRHDAYAICADCPARKFCFEFAVNATEIRDGIWGGEPIAEVRAERKRRNVAEADIDDYIDNIVRIIHPEPEVDEYDSDDDDYGDW